MAKPEITAHERFLRRFWQTGPARVARDKWQKQAPVDYVVPLRNHALRQFHGFGLKYGVCRTEEAQRAAVLSGVWCK